MSSWEEIANEVAPPGQTPGGLATGAARGMRKETRSSASLAEVLGATRFLECPPAAPADSSDTVWQGREEDRGDGPFYFIDRVLTDYDTQAASLPSRLERALQNPPSSWLEGLSPSDLLFCDIESCGLSSAEPLFLIGTLRFLDGEGRLQLFLARHPNEERAVLRAFGQSVPGKTLVTFNGKSFDWPYIEGRAARNLVKLPQPSGHYDLLFSARRKYRSQLPNCRLQTLEMGVCGRGRKGDIPSSRIPERYADFLEMTETKSRGAHLLAPVLFHNALDVLTMAELICCMSESA